MVCYGPMTSARAAAAAAVVVAALDNTLRHDQLAPLRGSDGSDGSDA